MVFDITLKAPMSLLLVGPSSAGKTFWMVRLLRERHELITDCPKHIVLFYHNDQPLYKLMLEEGLVTCMHKGIPSTTRLRDMAKTYKKDGGAMFLLDDSFGELETQADFNLLFMESVHHDNVSVILATQTLYGSGRRSNMRLISLNTNYLVIFKFIRDMSVFRSLSTQLRPFDPSSLLQSIMTALRNPYSYILFDFTANQASAVRIRTNIFEAEHPPLVMLEHSLD